MKRVPCEWGSGKENNKTQIILRRKLENQRRVFNSDPRWKVNTEEKEISGKYNTKDVGKAHKELYFNSLKFCILWLDIHI